MLFKQSTDLQSNKKQKCAVKVYVHVAIQQRKPGDTSLTASVLKQIHVFSIKFVKRLNESLSNE